MALVDVKYNPFTVETIIAVDGDTISEGSPLYELTVGKRLQEWIDKFSRKLVEVYGSKKFSFTYCGFKVDYNDFEQILEQDEKNGILSVSSIRFNESAKGDEAIDAIHNKVSSIFRSLQDGPYDVAEKCNSLLSGAFSSFNEGNFEAAVVATMSSGKSTVLNSLLGKELLPSSNTACTATMTEIIDRKNCSSFHVECFDKNKKLIEKHDNLTYSLMDGLNKNTSIDTIRITGNINFLSSDSVAVKIIDTPGPNSANNPDHRATTFKIINESSKLGVIIYVLNAEQFAINDDKALLESISDVVNKSAGSNKGKLLRDKFMFVVNKMDSFDPQKQNIQKELDKVKEYLEGFGIDEPRIFPCSSLLAMCLRDEFSQKIDINRIFDLKRSEECILSKDGQVALTAACLLARNEQMHLERYAPLPVEAREKIEKRLRKAIDEGDIKEQLLIHSGIPSLEAAIGNFINKYAKTCNISRFVNSLKDVLVGEELLSRFKALVSSDSKESEVLKQKLRKARAKLASGGNAKKIKCEIDMLDPMPEIEALMDECAASTNIRLSKEIRTLTVGECIEVNEAKRFVSSFLNYADDSMISLLAKFDDIINDKIFKVYRKLIIKYKNELDVLDKEIGDSVGRIASSVIDSRFAEVINKDARTFAFAMNATELDEAIKGVTEEKVVGYETKLELAGKREETITTSEKEKVYVGQEENPWYCGGWNPFSTKKYRPKYEMRNKTYSIWVDNVVERQVAIKRELVDTEKLVNRLINECQADIDDCSDKVKDGVKTYIDNLKESELKPTVDKVEKAIKDQYEELENYAIGVEDKESEIAKNRQSVSWIENKIAEIDSTLDIYLPFS